jgi:uncharacterized lipoprotein YddW (UPF0748 family)
MPSEAPATPKGSGSKWLRDARTVALYEADTGRKAGDDATYNRWIADQITNLLRDIRHMVNTTKRGCELSAATGHTPEHHLASYAQDIDTWMEERLLDAVYPMNYSEKLEEFGPRCDKWREIAKGTPVVMGVMMGAKDVDGQVERVRRSLDVHNGVAYFAYSKIFDAASDTLDDQGKDARFVRERVRKALLPKLDELSRSGAGG